MKAMATGIKIINILKGDSFEEVFDEFKAANADEVILIFPKNSQLVKDEAHFISLASEARRTDKTVTIMTADEKVRDFSQKYGFKWLASPGKSFDQDDQPEPEPEEDSHADEQENNDDDVDEENDDDADKKENDEDANEDEDEEKEESKEEPETVPLEEEPVDDNPLEEEWEETPTEANLAMAKFKRPVKGLAKSRKLASEKKLANLESIWFKGEQTKTKSQPLASIWSNVKLFSGSKTKGTKTNLFILAGAILVLALGLYLFLGQAQVILKPKKQLLDLTLNITASSRYSETDPQANQIPGQLLTAQEEISANFTATGEKEVAQKARGKITVYNNYSADPQIFVATTRFQSAIGLIFRTPRPISIPGARLVGGKLVPGSVVVEVLADKPGPSYNIGPGKFTIPGLQGSPKYDGFYAESSQNFTGGIIGIAKVVTEKDFSQAQEEVTQKSLEAAAAKLKTRAGDLKIIEPLANTVTALNATAEAEQATDGFEMKAVAEARTIGFSEEDLLELVRLSISREQAMLLLKDTLRLVFKNSRLDFENNTISFTVEIEGEAAVDIDKDKIVDGLLGKKQSAIRDYLLSIEEVESAKVTLSPFWVKSVPKNRHDIETQIIY